MNKVSITILSWNCREDLRRCLDSVLLYPASTDQEIIVVDNGSLDGSCELVRTDYPQVVLLQNDRNLGVAAARNQAMRLATGQYILHLDSDIVVHPSSLARLLTYMEQHPQTGLAGGRLLLADGSLQYSCRRFPTILGKLSRRIPLPDARRRLEFEDYAEWDHQQDRSVDYVVGACQILRRELLAAVGFYDEKIFYGPEDIDYCRRIWAAGYSVDYVASAELTHRYRRITFRGPLSGISLRHAAGLVYYFWKWRHQSPC